ncbi:MAG TPA: hypothetical protein VNI84_19600 [Pyrinomonadaceae bacterium]|nr:hypothetical protein [Pyrinomonadaceae bacterium]
MRFEIIRQFLGRHSNSDKIGQFAVDWIEIEIDAIEARGMTDNSEDTFCGAMSWRVGTLLKIMKEDAPCRAFFRELHLLCEPPSAQRNTKMVKLYAEYPPEKPVINYEGRYRQ